MFRCLVEDQCPACGCNSLRGAINAEAVGNSVADRVEGVERTGLSSTKPATISVRHRDKLDLFSYGKQKLIFILFLDCFSLSSPSPPPPVSLRFLYCPFPFSNFSLYFHCFPLFRRSPTLFLLSPISCCVEPRCLFRTTILFTESCPLFFPPCFSFCPFVVSVSSSSPLRPLLPFSLAPFTLSRLMHSYRKLQVKTFR